MKEFNIRISSVDKKGLMEAAQEISIFEGLACLKLVGKSLIIKEVASLLPQIKDASEVLSDSENIEGLDAIKLKEGKFPIDCAIILEGDSYLVMRGKTVFGAVNEIEGYSLTQRIIDNIKRNYL